jgi:hypothetical protein
MLDYFNTEILPELDKLNALLDEFNQTWDESINE